MINVEFLFLVLRGIVRNYIAYLWSILKVGSPLTTRRLRPISFMSFKLKSLIPQGEIALYWGLYDCLGNSINNWIEVKETIEQRTCYLGYPFHDITVISPLYQNQTNVMPMVIWRYLDLENGLFEDAGWPYVQFTNSQKLMFHRLQHSL